MQLLHTHNIPKPRNAVGVAEIQERVDTIQSAYLRRVWIHVVVNPHRPALVQMGSKNSVVLYSLQHNKLAQFFLVIVINTTYRKLLYITEDITIFFNIVVRIIYFILGISGSSL